MARRKKEIIMVSLYCQSGTDFSIVDGDGKKWTIEDARQAWEEGRVEYWNLAFERLADLRFDIEALKSTYLRNTPL